MHQIIEYVAAESIGSPLGRGGPVGQNHRTHAEAVTEIHRLLNNDEWKVNGYNEEEDYNCGRDASPAKRRRVLRVER